MSESILWNAMGNLHMRLGSFEEAISSYEMAIKLEPDFSQAYSNLGHALFSKGDYEGAISLLQKSITLADSIKEQSVAWKRLGDAYHKLGEYEKALEAYRKGDEFDALSKPASFAVETVKEQEIAADSSQSSVIIGDDLVEMQTGDEPVKVDVMEIFKSESIPAATPPFLVSIEEIAEKPISASESMEKEAASDSLSLESIDAAPEVEDEFGEFHNWLQTIDHTPTNNSTTQSGNNQNDGTSVRPFQKYTRIPPLVNPEKENQYVMLEGDRADLRAGYHSDNKTWDSVETVSKISQGVSTVVAQQSASPQVIELERDNRSELFKSWKLSEQPEHDPAVWKSMLDALEKGQSQKNSVQVLEPATQEMTASAAKAEKDTPKTKVTREVLDAIENYRKITSMAPNNDKGWDTLGKLLKDAGEYSDAVDAFSRAIVICPSKDLYHYHLGLVFAAQKRHDEAIDSFKKVIDLNPGYTLAHCALAGSYRRLGMESEANAHIKVALPRLEAETEYNRACFEAICGNTDQAIELLKQALEMKQTSPEWVRGDPDLDFIRNDPRFIELVGD